MPPRNSQLIKPESSEIEHQPPSGFIARPNQTSNPIAAVPQAQALAIQELEISFDHDLRLAMIERLVQAQQEINSLATSEQKLAKVVELGRLAATEKAREDGVQIARAEFAAKLKKQKEAQQQQFLKSELPKLIQACEFMLEADMKITVEAFAARLDIKLNWEQTDEGLRCVPVVA
ncbi:MAG: hypothetical protein ACFKPT_02780 [Gloeotrichia echinulata GP01]